MVLPQLFEVFTPLGAHHFVAVLVQRHAGSDSRQLQDPLGESEVVGGKENGTVLIHYLLTVPSSESIVLQSCWTRLRTCRAGRRDYSMTRSI